MKYTSRADLLIAAGESIKMQEKAGICPKCKFDGISYNIKGIAINDYSPERFEFPLAVVEGKPVFVGDELYCNDIKVVIGDCDKGFLLPQYSWNPPKPKTVMVELLREDAEIVLGTLSMYPLCASVNRAEEAISKALEKA